MTPDAAPYRFERSGRTPRAAAILLAVWAGVALLVVYLDAALWIAALLVLPSLPALVDWLSDRRAGLEIGADGVVWTSGRREGRMALAEIDHVRVVTGWDLGLRVALVDRNGKRIRLPAECLPRADRLVPALDAQGLKIERHHFIGV